MRWLPHAERRIDPLVVGDRGSTRRDLDDGEVLRCSAKLLGALAWEKRKPARDPVVNNTDSDRLERSPAFLTGVHGQVRIGIECDDVGQ